MPIDMHWEDHQQNILHYRFVDFWNGVDLYALNRQAWDMLNQVRHNVTLMLDFTAEGVVFERSRVPLLRMLMNSHPNLTHVLLVGNTPQVKFIEQVMRRVYPERHITYQCVDDLTTAYHWVTKELGIETEPSRDAVNA